MTNLVSGAATNPAPKNADDSGAGSFTNAVTTAGTDGDIDLVTNTITSATHGYATDQAVVPSTAGTFPVGLEAGVVYFVDKTDANSFRLRSRQGDANSIVDISTMGAGIHSMSAVQRFSVQFNAEVAGDQAYLPLQSKARLYITSGASDSCVVVDARVTQAD